MNHDDRDADKNCEPEVSIPSPKSDPQAEEISEEIEEIRREIRELIASEPHVAPCWPTCLLRLMKARSGSSIPAIMTTTPAWVDMCLHSIAASSSSRLSRTSRTPASS